MRSHFQAEGHRGDYVMALAARAHAALRGTEQVELDDIVEVAPLALQHRRPSALQGEDALWAQEDDNIMTKIIQNSNFSDESKIKYLFSE